VESVVVAAYAYVGMLAAAGPLEWVWLEEGQLAANSFRFLNKARPMDHCVTIASNAHHVPLTHAMSTSYLFTRYNPDEIAALLECMTPARSRITVWSKLPEVASKCTESERWYGTKYGRAEQSAEFQAACAAARTAYAALCAARGATKTAAELPAADTRESAFPPLALLSTDAAAWAAGVWPALALPEPNEFVPTDFELHHPALAEKQRAGLLRVASDDGAAEGEEGDDESDDEGEDEGGAGAEESKAAEGKKEPPPPPPFAERLAAIKRKRIVVPDVLVEDAAGVLLWHLDDHFAVPKAICSALLELPPAYASPRNVALLQLYVRLVKETLNELAYAASLTELHYDVSASGRGIAVHCHGFSHKLQPLVARVADKVVAAPFSDLVRRGEGWGGERGCSRCMASNAEAASHCWRAT
jgi:secreted Zn-dependent insulinase-like peptidase